jgi:hypothetical protein
MTNDDSIIDRADIAADMERARLEFHQLLVDADANDAWAAPTRGTPWNNEQLLCHMLFGYMIVQLLLILVKAFSRLPDAVSRRFAQVLNATAGPFDVINYYGSCAAALVYNRHRMGAKADRVIASLQRGLSRESDSALQRAMHFPTRWDPFFSDYMTLEDVYRYPREHFDFHHSQLTLDPTERR